MKPLPKIKRLMSVLHIRNDKLFYTAKNVRKDPFSRRMAVTLVVKEGDSGWFQVYAAYCSKKDDFCKRKGIETALSKIPFTVQLKDLPATMASLACNIEKGGEAKHYISQMRNWCWRFV